MQDLRDERIGDVVVDGGTEIDEALLEQPAVDVHDAFALRGAADHVGDGVGAHRFTPNPVAAVASGRIWVRSAAR